MRRENIVRDEIVLNNFSEFFHKRYMNWQNEEEMEFIYRKFFAPQNLYFQNSFKVPKSDPSKYGKTFRPDGFLFNIKKSAWFIVEFKRSNVSGASEILWQLKRYYKYCKEKDVQTEMVERFPQFKHLILEVKPKILLITENIDSNYAQLHIQDFEIILRQFRLYFLTTNFNQLRAELSKKSVFGYGKVMKTK